MSNPIPRPSFLRHSGNVNPTDLVETLNIIGCGAVGSHVALQAARMGWTRFQVWDKDIVEDFNLPNQAYMPRHIGLTKVDALQDILSWFNPDIKFTGHKEFFVSSEHKGLLSGPLVIATDSMKSRADITRAFQFNSAIPAVVEARLGFDYGEVHHIQPLAFDSVQGWKRTLKRDEDIPDGPCNLRICPTLVGVVSNTVVQYLCYPYTTASQQNEGRGVKKEIPFMTRFLFQESLRTWVYNLPVVNIQSDVDDTQIQNNENKTATSLQ